MINNTTNPRSENAKIIVSTIRQIFPDVDTIYVFGSRATGDENSESDFDLAVLIQRPIVPTDAAKAKILLSSQLRQDIDLVDLLRADTVTRFQVVSSGIVLWEGSPRKTAEFETVTASMYAILNEERAEILADVLDRGSVYG